MQKIPCTPSLLDSVPQSLPALAAGAERSQTRRKDGLSGRRIMTWDKAAEERAEFVMKPQVRSRKRTEFGDILFALINAARWEAAVMRKRH